MNQIGMTMLPTLQGEFPKIETYLFVGGPKHGQWLDVVEGEPTHKVLCPPAAGDLAGYDAHTYIRSEICAEDQNGAQFARVIYVHWTIPDAGAAQSALIAALFADFVRGGRKVVDNGTGV